jgi:AraC-like DNA-binding protein
MGENSLRKLRSDREHDLRPHEAACDPGEPTRRQLAFGNGWTVAEVICTAGPQDRPFEEQHLRTSVSIVVSGSFQYRTSTGRQLMTPGSLLLGNAGDGFTCGHEHGTGDRCVAFWYDQEFLERTAAGVGMTRSRFHTPRLAPVRRLSALVALASELLMGTDPAAFEELGIRALTQAIQLQDGCEPRPNDAEPGALARVTRVVRMIENDPDVPHDLASLAHIARLSPYHFLRTFEGVTGTTPHQYLLRMRLRRIAVRLRTERGRILDIALECGFGDVSNFNRVFSRRVWGQPACVPRQPWRIPTAKQNSLIKLA